MMFHVVISFWPSEGSDGALLNRFRSTSTWMIVLLSKVAGLISPIYLADATNELVSGDLKEAMASICIYCTLRFLNAFFREMQSLVYLKVKQQANIQLACQTFSR